MTVRITVDGGTRAEAEKAAALLDLALLGSPLTVIGRSNPRKTQKPEKWRVHVEADLEQH